MGHFLEVKAAINSEESDPEAHHTNMHKKD
jgi:hypothetical protein